MGSVKRNLSITVFSAILFGILLILLILKTKDNKTQGSATFVFAISFYGTIITLVLVFGFLKFLLLEKEEFDFESTGKPQIWYKEELDKPPSYSEVTEEEKPPCYDVSMKTAYSGTATTFQSSMRKALLRSTKSCSLSHGHGLPTKSTSTSPSADPNVQWFEQQSTFSAALESRLLLSPSPRRNSKRNELKRFRSCPGP